MDLCFLTHTHTRYLFDTCLLKVQSNAVFRLWGLNIGSSFLYPDSVQRFPQWSAYHSNMFRRCVYTCIHMEMCIYIVSDWKNNQVYIYNIIYTCLYVYNIFSPICLHIYTHRITEIYPMAEVLKWTLFRDLDPYQDNYLHVIFPYFPPTQTSTWCHHKSKAVVFLQSFLSGTPLSNHVKPFGCDP